MVPQRMRAKIWERFFHGSPGVSERMPGFLTWVKPWGVEVEKSNAAPVVSMCFYKMQVLVQLPDLS